MKNPISPWTSATGCFRSEGCAAGVTRQTIVVIENAKYSPTLELAFRIARVFGKPLEEVFQYDDQAR